MAHELSSLFIHSIDDNDITHQADKTVDVSPACCTENENCDEECIKTVAAIECPLAWRQELTDFDDCISLSGTNTAVTQVSKNHRHSESDHDHGNDGQYLGKACRSHLRIAMDKYSSYLASARCVCQSFLQGRNGINLCCTKDRLCLSDLQPLIGTSSGYSCANQSDALINRQSARDTSVTVFDPLKNSNSCCAGKQCSKVVTASKLVHKKEPEIDIEKVGDLAHVTLNVDGMDCSGCANKLARALSSFPGVRNVQVTFVTAIAQFNLDPAVSQLDEVIKQSTRATGYRLTPLATETIVLDILMDGRIANRFQDSLPLGVESCRKSGKDAYQISYQPEIIGAREVLQATEGGKLAGPQRDQLLDLGKQKYIKTGLLTSLAFLLTMPVVVLEWAEPKSVPERTILYISMVLATLVQAIAYPVFYKPAFSSLIYARVLEMDMLVVLSITAAYGYSVVAFGLTLAGKELETDAFFETSTLLITLVLIGRFLATWTRKKAIQALSVESLQISTALLVDPSTDNVVEIDARLLQYGDIIQIRPHTQIVTDAVIISGTSEVDESMLTGESLPAFKTDHQSVMGGTINGVGTLLARVIRLPGRNTITDIANLVSQAQNSKPRVQDLADKVASYFLPVVFTAAIIVIVIWVVVVLKVRRLSASSAIGTAIGYGIAVLAVSCPCALGLAVPMVLVVAGGVAARRGVIIKSADVIERGYKVTDVIFDKTGTLTTGHLEVVQEQHYQVPDVSDAQGLAIIKAIVSSNNHPVSRAVASMLQQRTCSPVQFESSTLIPGRGIEAIWNDSTIRAGNPSWLEVDQVSKVVEMKDLGLTLLCITIDSHLLGVFGLQSALRPEAGIVIDALNKRKIGVHIVSGDNRTVVSSIASSLGISEENAAAERSPAQKQDYVRDLMTQGKIVLFCGDGINDAVAIAQANVGVQIESSSDVTRAIADVVLLANLKGVIDVLDISRASFHRIIFNFAWSAIYNVLAILLAGGAFVKVRIPPAYAGLGEIVSVIPVIFVALTMSKDLWIGKKRRTS